MVGRIAALDDLRRAWALVRTGAPSVPVVVTGEPGTGKSTLVTAALEAFGAPRVLCGSARVHSPAPYDWLAAVLVGRDTSAVPVPPDALAWLAQDPDAPRQRYAPEAR